MMRKFNRRTCVVVVIVLYPFLPSFSTVQYSNFFLHHHPASLELDYESTATMYLVPEVTGAPPC